MIKSEIKSRLLNGERLENILNFTDGQECIIYKGEWSTGDDVIYIPDTIFNNIWIDAPLDEDEIYDVLGYMYTGKDFMDLADGNEEFAKRLFYYCDWQHPSSALPEIDKDNDEYPELNEYFFNDEEMLRDISRDDDGIDINDIGRFEIIFDVNNKRYYCFVDAINIDEALGIFFRNHPHITYEMILDHMEV